MRTLPCLAALALSACMLPPSPPTDPNDDPVDQLAEVAPSLRILAIPQDETAGILGAAVDPQTGAPIPTRMLVVPRSNESSGYSSYSGLREMSRSAGVVVDSDLVSADVGFEDITHLSYDVTVDRTIYLSGEQVYDPRSRCCAPDGTVAPECAGGQVTRVYVGSGELRYLRRGDRGASFGAGPIEIHSGISYEVARERSFTYSIFAVEVASAEDVCGRAYCDQREGESCARCRVVAAQSDLDEASAPATALMRVVCEGMDPTAPVYASLRGEVGVEGCWEDAHVSLGLETRGASTEEWTLAEPNATDSPLVWAQQTPEMLASPNGTVVASLNLLDCRCGAEPARCVLDPDLELAVQRAPL